MEPLVISCLILLMVLQGSVTVVAYHRSQNAPRDPFGEKDDWGTEAMILGGLAAVLAAVLIF